MVPKPVLGTGLALWSQARWSSRERKTGKQVAGVKGEIPAYQRIVSLVW